MKLMSSWSSFRIFDLLLFEIANVKYNLLHPPFSYENNTKILISRPPKSGRSLLFRTKWWIPYTWSSMRISYIRDLSFLEITNTKYNPSQLHYPSRGEKTLMVLGLVFFVVISRRGCITKNYSSLKYETYCVIVSETCGEYKQKRCAETHLCIENRLPKYGYQAITNLLWKEPGRKTIA